MNLRKTYSIAVHGGCGNIEKGRFTAEEEEAYRERLRESLRVGAECLEQGGNSIEAVARSIELLEDSTLFNAGRGSVFTHQGTHEMDASIMEGRNREAGSISGVSRVEHPIRAAQSIMDASTHVMLSGQGAEAFAESQGLSLVDPSWFDDATRWEQYQKALKEGRHFMDHSSDDNKHGTVGAIALDRHGHLAAGTSTGGITNKKFGRIGDSSVIGAGTYADDRTCAVSCTGEGEYFLRGVTAIRISDLMEFGKRSLAEASEEALKIVSALGGEGGLIALDRAGRIHMPFSTSGMFRGFATEAEVLAVWIYGKNEE